jgi:hypothetical protein
LFLQSFCGYVNLPETNQGKEAFMGWFGKSKKDESAKETAQESRPQPLKPKWRSVVAWDVRTLNGETLVILENGWRTATPHPTLKGPDGLPVHFNGAAYNLPTFKSYLLAMKKLGHGMEYEQEALAKLIETTTKLGAPQFQIRLVNNEPVAIYPRTAGSLVGKLGTDNASIFVPPPGLTVKNRAQLASYIEELKSVELDTGLEESMLATLEQAAHILANPPPAVAAPAEAEEKPGQPKPPAP